MYTKYISKILSGSVCLLLTMVLLSCEEDGVTRESLPESFDPPTITILSGPENGVIGGVAGASAGISFEVTSPWGLNALLLNDVEIVKLPQGQLLSTVSYSIPIPPDAVMGEPFLEAVFTVVDELGQSNSTGKINVERFGLPEEFVLNTISGAEISRDNETIGGIGNSVPRIKLGGTGSLGLDYAYAHLVFNDNMLDTFLDFGVAPSATPDKTSMAWTRNTGGKYKGFNSIQIDFDTFIPEEIITDVINGDRVIKVDVYYEKPAGADDVKEFASILNISNVGTYNRGSKAGILLEFTDTLTAANEWQTLIYDQVPPNDWASQNTVEDPGADEIDMIDFSISRGFKNPDDATYYIRNIRMEKVN